MIKSQKYRATQASKRSWQPLCYATKLLALLAVSLSCVQAVIKFPIDGIGYREQELQLAKGTFFNSETPNGVSHASFYGGTNIFIKGPVLAPSAQENRIMMYSHELEATVQAPLLTENDAFLSNTDAGFIVYRMPSLTTILGIPDRVLDKYMTMTFTIHLFVRHDLYEPFDAECKNKAKCTMTFRRSHTPIIYSLRPPVVYFNSITSVWFDPKNTVDLITDLPMDELHFINYKIGGSLMDFEGFIDNKEPYSKYNRNHIAGKVGDQLPNANHDMNMLWEVGNANIQPIESVTCSFDNSTCYQAKTVPVIFSQDHNSGFTTGGQVITVKGHGFTGGNITAEVDGVPCEVDLDSVKVGEFDCRVASKAAVSDLSKNYVGQHGIRQKTTNSTANTANQHVWVQNQHLWERYDGWTQVEELALTPESQVTRKDRLGYDFKGWFVAPATGRYRFLISCEVICRFHFDKTAGSSSNTTQFIQEVHSGFRKYHYTSDMKKRVTDWVNLTEGEHYYLNAQHAHRQWGGYISVGVEIERDNSSAPGHHHSIREIQQVEARIENNKDTTRITVENPDNGNYYLNFKWGNGFKKSKKIKSNATAKEFRDAVRTEWCDWTVRTSCSVNLTMYDAAGEVTDDHSLTVKNVYHLMMHVLRSTPSTTQIMVAKVGSSSTIKVGLPIEVGLSSPPLTGHFRFKCTDAKGYVSYSRAIHYKASANNVNSVLMESCEGLYDRVETLDENPGWKYNDRENGLNFLIRFQGVNEDPGLIEIENVEGGTMTGNNMTFVTTVRQPYSTNLQYDVIPFEMLRTFETKPQLIVSIGDQPAVCHSVACDYTYIEPTGEISSFTYNEATKLLSVEGSAFPANITDVKSLEFALTDCLIDSTSYTETHVECTLTTDPTVGSWKPIFLSEMGFIPADSTTAVVIASAVTTATPSSDYNLLGGDEIVFAGSNLPRDLKRSTIEIKFSDAQETKCIPLSASGSELKCRTEKFAASSTSASLSLVITINGQTVTNSLTMAMKDNIKSTQSLVPSSVSPVLKTKVTVTLEASFPHALDKKDLSMWVTNRANSSITKLINVVSVDDSAKTFIGMFGGAESGVFDVFVRHSTYGLIDTSSQTLSVGSTVTSVSPKTGSIYGGNILTIQGTNFGTEKTDNPVQISFNGGVGSVNCFVLTTMETQITCRVDDTIEKEAAEEGLVIVFLKTYEEAVCDLSICGGYTFTSNVPNITAAVTQFDTTSGNWEMKITGSSFQNSKTLTVGGAEQALKSATDTDLTFTLSELTSQTVKATLLFASGKPAGHSVLDAGVSLSSKFTGLTPSVGSVGGSTITLTMPGATSGTNIKIKDASDNEICESIRVETYGKVQCDTKPVEIAAAAIKVFQDEDEINCDANDANACQFEQKSEGMPDVSSVVKAGSTIVFTGTDFITTGFANASFAGVAADSVVVDSATQATATWTLGVPLNSNASKPILSFTNDAKTETFKAAMTPQLLNAVSVTSNSAALECSFAGGCEFEIAAEGLATMLKTSNDAKLTVCERNCEFNEEASSASSVKCSVPAVSTKFSDNTHGIQVSHKLSGFKVSGSSGNVTEAMKVFDDNIHYPYEDDSNDCHVTAEFMAGHVAILDKVKIFLDNDFNKEDFYVNKLKIQGSADGSTWTDIETADNNVRTGWNYFEWEEESERPVYRFVRISGPQHACRVNEMELWGIETIDNTEEDFTCQPRLSIGGQNVPLTGDVKYKGALTTSLDSILPRYGRVEGGTSVTFTGLNFVTDTSAYSIVIDRVVCAVTAATTTSVTCTTGSRPGLRKSSLVMTIAGRGQVSLQGNTFTYVNAWSSDVTWGGEFAPLEGESVYVPEGLNLLVDVDSTPVLNAVIVEGSIIFAPEVDPNHERTFDAAYIFVRYGKFECGTEEYPYTSKITITMHGKISDPYIPIYGNKVLALRHGTLDMHGPVRNPVWTQLETTAEKNSLEITLQRAVDWQVGEEIAIASTSFESREAEKRSIVAIDRTDPEKPKLTLNKKLVYKHYAKTLSYGGEEIDMRAEVGLLSRSVKFQGDSDSEDMTYGATIFLHSMGDDSLTARLENIEFTNMGQAFKLGRYAIHFHMIGNVHKSYIRGNSMNTSFNRAFTMHGTSYLRIINNVVYNVMGHNIFIEDAVERFNQIHDNLIIMTKRSFSLLNTDSTPGSMWITNPNNDFTGNHAAGSDRYSYWYDLQIHAMGAYADTNICPENERVGRFFNNTGHSNGRYGLRVFHEMKPRTYPCKPMIFDPNNETDPYWQNPPLTAEFRNFTGWKNKRNGAIAEVVGDVRFIDFKTADNILAGMEMGIITLDSHQDKYYAQINNGTVVGMTGLDENSEKKQTYKSAKGIIGGRRDGLLIDGVKFYNLDWKESAALGDCSHCYHPQASDAGARTQTVKNLFFDQETVPRKLRYGYPYNGIFHDLTGELTGKGPNTYTVAYLKTHEYWSECTTDREVFDGHACDSTVQIRRISYYGAKKSSQFTGTRMYIMPWDESYINSRQNITEDLYKKDEFGSVEWTDVVKQDPPSAWTFGIVTGHRYRIHWGISGMDFLEMNLQVHNKWEPTDKGVLVYNNFTDIREDIDYEMGGTLWPNDTLVSQDPLDQNHQRGQYVVYNDPATRMMIYPINGKNNTVANKATKFTAKQCTGSCNIAVTVVESENRTRLWSRAADWPNNTVPAAGEDVEVVMGWNMIFDLEDSPVYKDIQINGKLTFKNESNCHLHANTIYVRAGELHIGSEEYPFIHEARITLHGGRDDHQGIVVHDAIEAGNKILANVGVIRMYGIKRPQKMSRLTAIAPQNSTSITIELGMDLVQGDRIAIAPTGFDNNAYDQVVVNTYNNVTGEVTFNSSLKHYHWGAAESTANKYNGLDIRGEVLLLSRNIVIAGEDRETWGGQVLTTDSLEVDSEGEMMFRTGSTIMHNVEVYNCSQKNLEKSAIRFEGATGSHSHLKGVSVHNGHSWGILVWKSANVLIEDSGVFNFIPLGIVVKTSNNFTLTNSVLIGVSERDTDSFSSKDLLDVMGGVTVCAIDDIDVCSDISITHNIAAGAPYAAFVVPAKDCDKPSDMTFRHNVGHSTNGGLNSGFGALIHPVGKQMSTCYEGSDFMAYKTNAMGMTAMKSAHIVQYKNLTMIDTRRGSGPMASTQAFKDEYVEVIMKITDSTFYGESEIPDCPHGEGVDSCFFFDKQAIIPGTVQVNTKQAHQRDTSGVPIDNNMFDPSWAGVNYIERNKFIGFKARTHMDQNMAIYRSNPTVSSYQPPMYAKDNSFIDCEDDALFWFESPNPKWANVKDCGDFPCTAPLNILISHTGSKWLGKKPDWATPDFQLIANNSGFAPFVETCKGYPNMNGYICQKNTLSIINFQSEDEDWRDRSVQPVYLKQQGTEISNKINSQSDQVWDGFYAGQKRNSRFPGIIDAAKGNVYDIVYTGTPPKEQRFELYSHPDASAAITVRIAYPDAAAYQLKVDGKTIEMNQWDDNLQNYGPIVGSKCGENRFLAVVNILEFYLKPGCTAFIAPRNAIMTKVRMEWTMDDFYAKGGTTSFVDRLAASLGIHGSSIKVVGVYEGSLVVDYNIYSDNDDNAVLQQIQAKQTEQIATGSLDLGAPVLDFGQGGQSIVSDGVVAAPGYDPIILTPTLTNSGANYKSATNSAANIPQNTQQTLEESSVSRGSFSPDISIIEQEEETQSQVTKKFKPAGSADSFSWVLIGLGFLVVVCLVFSVRYLIRYTQVQAIDALRIKQQKEAYEAAKTNSMYETTRKIAANVEMSNAKMLHVEEPEEQVQYDAKHDFAIFGSGDPRQGGIQSLAEKMNIADNVVDDFEKNDQTTNSKSNSVPSQNSASALNSGSSGNLPEDKEIEDL